MISRRNVFAAAVGLGSALSLKPAQAAQEGNVEALTAALAEALAKRHGGAWHEQIDDGGRFVTLFKLPDRKG